MPHNAALRDIEAVACDIDGTLYPAMSFNIRLAPVIVRHPFFMLAIKKTRSRLHELGKLDDFYKTQTEIVCEYLKKDFESVDAQINELVYHHWDEVFFGVKRFPHVKELILKLKASGIKLAVLSDFPVGKKLIALGLTDLWDCELCAEDSSALKPEAAPFDMLSERIGVAKSKILYVGNSIRFDHAGAKRAGLKSAILVKPSKKAAADFLGFPPDFVFSDYRELTAKLFGAVPAAETAGTAGI
jgi:putative hydrolase of the HAD superfamily